ncbi:hypothetical protein OOT00_12915 [Desulfobotulus sp. H1]|uniref:Flagellar protein FliL n=1 Tax=Desulfobotulus pelophilus TaxID=2823377 RepID=A0ABT3NBP6_9BACT|nr:hypothetical protein [Desulfobotulus pelophilus]MCW7754886.1 hypothetical protein [Desulfobotulus pelophilus]
MPHRLPAFRYLLLLFIPLLFFGCEKLAFILGEPPFSYTYTYTGPLADQSLVKAEITLGFSSQDGVLEARRQLERMRYATDLIVRPYTGKQLNDKGKRMRRIIKRVSDTLLQTPVKRIHISQYEVIFREDLQRTPGSGETEGESQLPRTFHGN